MAGVLADGTMKHQTVLPAVLFFARGARPGVILLAAQWRNLPLFALKSVYRRHLGEKKPSVSTKGASDEVV
jgi:hypothetical protein